MPDLVSRKKHEKKVLDRWENEGGRLFANEKKSSGSNQQPQRKRRKDRRKQLTNAGSA